MAEKDTILIMLGPLETLNDFAKEAGKGLEQCGVKVVFIKIIDDNAVNVANIKEALLSNSILAALTFNNTALTVNVEGTNIWDLYGIKIFNWLVDHPVNYFSNIDVIPGNTVFLCVDRAHVEFVNAILPKNKCFFMPHAGIISSSSKLAAFDEREFDIAYFGTVKYDINNPDPNIINRMNNDSVFSWLAEYYIDNPNQISYYEAFQLMQRNFQFNIEDKNKLLELLSIYYFAWDLGIVYYRQYLIKALAKMGLKIHVFGNNWSEILKDVENVTYHGIITPTQCLEYMGKSKIVLNNMPGFTEGSHERVFNSMLQGAVCCSNYSEYLGEQFVDNTDIIFYEEKNLQRTGYQLQDILSDKVRWQMLSEAGFNKVNKSHTYAKRMEELLSIIRSVK